AFLILASGTYNVYSPVPGAAPIFQGLAGIPEGAGYAQAGDAVPLKAPDTAELVWLPRGQAAYGQPLLQAVQARLAAASSVAAGDELEEIDIDAQILWEQADASVAGPLY
ncbi:hypothetical protein VVD43_33335, partial [Pseudomonas aeruginosa]